MKKILAILFFSLSLTSVHAQKEFTADGIAYSITSDNTVKVTRGGTKIPSGGTYKNDSDWKIFTNILGMMDK